tara:strand:- start:2457 stop:2909 length:453 start_codon:yes stop_codon:yes gene_type:complete
MNRIQYILNQEDLHLFKVFCQFVWFQGEPLPLIFDIENEVYVKQGITLSTLKRLEGIGLIIFESDGYIKKRLGQHTRLFYKGKPTKIGFPGKIDNQLDVGHVLLTATGKDRALACETSWNQEFYEYVIRRWYQQGFVLSSIQINRQFLKE